LDGTPTEIESATTAVRNIACCFLLEFTKQNTNSLNLRLMTEQGDKVSDAVFIQMRSRPNSPSAQYAKLQKSSSTIKIQATSKLLESSNGFNVTDLTTSPYTSIQSRDANLVVTSNYSSQSRWKSPEFWLYYVAVALALRKMVMITVELSQRRYSLL
jgi:hypothetical protein